MLLKSKYISVFIVVGLLALAAFYFSFVLDLFRRQSAMMNLGGNMRLYSKTGRDEYGQPFPIYFKFLVRIPQVCLSIFKPFQFRFLVLMPFPCVSFRLFMLFWSMCLSHLALSLRSCYHHPWTILMPDWLRNHFCFCIISLGIIFYRKPLLSFTLLSLSTYAAYRTLSRSFNDYINHSYFYRSAKISINLYFLFYWL